MTLNPILETKTGDASKLSHVVGHDRQAFAAGMPRDHHVMQPNGRACLLKLRPKLTVMGGGAISKREYIQPRTELLDHRKIFARPRRFFCAIDELSESDH